MRKGTRRILFWFAVIVFGAASWVALLMAQGYKYDFSRNTFVRTGAIAVTVNTDARFYVNDREGSPPSFLSHRTGSNRLLPGTYTVRLAKDGYSTWAKTATVQEGLLTDFPTVILLPIDTVSLPDMRSEMNEVLKHSLTIADATPTPMPSPAPSPRPKKSIPDIKQVSIGAFTLRGAVLYRTDSDPEIQIADNVLGIAMADDASRILWWTRNEIWVLWLRSTDYQPFRSEGERQLITRFSIPILRAAWFRDHDHIVVDLGANAYRVLETDTRGGINIIRI